MKRQWKIIWILIVTILCNCNTEQEKVPEYAYIKSRLQLPQLSNFPFTNIEVDTTDQLESRTYPFNLKLSENEIVNFNDSIDYHRFNWRLDTLSYSTSNLLDLIIDTSQLFSWKYWESYIVEPTIITAEGKEIQPKTYKRPYNHVSKLPVFIYNYGDSLEAVEVHDGRLIVIQEALTETNKWLPIEYFVYSGCGNSYGSRKIEPGKFMLFTINKYNGDFKTKLRLKMRSNGNTIISNEFHGSINKEQLKPIKDSETFWNSYLDEEGY